MKTLLILRHAKSDWNQSGLADHDRPLNKRGLADAPRIGRLLQQQGLVPDLIISSTAKRAITTAKLVAEAGGYEAEIVETGQFYHGYPEDYLAVLNEQGDPHQRVLVVGHNPGLEELVEQLTGRAATLTTANLVQVSLPLDSWSKLSEETVGSLVNLWRPNTLPF